jgi:hypothetical protein
MQWFQFHNCINSLNRVLHLKFVWNNIIPPIDNLELKHKFSLNSRRNNGADLSCISLKHPVTRFSTWCWVETRNYEKNNSTCPLAAVMCKMVDPCARGDIDGPRSAHQGGIERGRSHGIGREGGRVRQSCGGARWRARRGTESVRRRDGRSDGRRHIAAGMGGGERRNGSGVRRWKGRDPGSQMHTARRAGHPKATGSSGFCLTRSWPCCVDNIPSFVL